MLHRRRICEGQNVRRDKHVCKCPSSPDPGMKPRHLLALTGPALPGDKIMTWQAWFVKESQSGLDPT